MKGKLEPMRFEYDHRTKNPKLHLLYVRWAMNHLALVDETIEKMHQFSSNFNMMNFIQAIQQQKSYKIKTDAAWFEAAARLAAGDEVPDYHEDEDHES